MRRVALLVLAAASCAGARPGIDSRAQVICSNCFPLRAAGTPFELSVVTPQCSAARPRSNTWFGRLIYGTNDVGQARTPPELPHCATPYDVEFDVTCSGPCDVSDRGMWITPREAGPFSFTAIARGAPNIGFSSGPHTVLAPDSVALYCRSNFRDDAAIPQRVGSLDTPEDAHDMVPCDRRKMSATDAWVMAVGEFDGGIYPLDDATFNGRRAPRHRRYQALYLRSLPAIFGEQWKGAGRYLVEVEYLGTKVRYDLEVTP